MSKFIFLDTNNWIYLSNGFDVRSNSHENLHFKLFDFISRKTAEGSLVLLVNDIVIDEWKRNRQEAEKQLKIIENKYKSYNQSLNSIKEFLGKDDKSIKKIRDKLTNKYQKKIVRYRKHIDEVEDFLLNKTLKIEVSDKNKIDAANLALAKKAPFIGDKKNSMADALILLSSMEYIEVNKKESISPFSLIGDDEEFFVYPDSYFVSSNSGDFCDPKDKNLIHSDLAPFLSQTKTEFYYSLGKLVNAIEEEYLTVEEMETIDHFDDRVFCDYCNFDHYPSVNFSEYFRIFNPRKFHLYEDQMRINFPGEEEIDLEKEAQRFGVLIRTAICEHCDTLFFECPCGELNIIEDNERLECSGCGEKYKIETDVFGGGVIGGFEIQIADLHKCKLCGYEFEEVDEEGLCEDCAEIEYRNIYD